MKKRCDVVMFALVSKCYNKSLCMSSDEDLGVHTLRQGILISIGIASLRTGHSSIGVDHSWVSHSVCYLCAIPDLGFINIFGVCLHCIELDSSVLGSELAVFHSKLHAKQLESH